MSEICYLIDLAFSQKDLVRILKQSGQIVPDFLKPLPDGTYKGNKIPRVIRHPFLSVCPNKKSLPKVDVDAQKHRDRRDGESYAVDWDGRCSHQFETRQKTILSLFCSVTGPCTPVNKPIQMPQQGGGRGGRRGGGGGGRGSSSGQRGGMNKQEQQTPQHGGGSGRGGRRGGGNGEGGGRGSYSGQSGGGQRQRGFGGPNHSSGRGGMMKNGGAPPQEAFPALPGAQR